MVPNAPTIGDVNLNVFGPAKLSRQTVARPKG